MKKFKCIYLGTCLFLSITDFGKSCKYMKVQYNRLESNKIYRNVCAYCVVHLFCFSSSCVPYVASFSGLFIFWLTIRCSLMFIYAIYGMILFIILLAFGWFCWFMVLNATFNNYSYILAVSFIGGGNQRTWRKPPTCCKSLTNFITYCCIVHFAMTRVGTYNFSDDRHWLHR